MSPAVFPTLAGICIVILAGYAAYQSRETSHSFARHAESLAKGLLLGISLYLSLLATSAAGWIRGTIVVVIGALLFEAIRFLLRRASSPTKHDARALLFGNILSNVSHGLFIAGAFGAGIFLGVGSSLGILSHSLKQETKEHRTLIAAGYSKNGAFTRDVFVSLFILLGIAVGIGAFPFPFLSSLLSGLAAGGILSLMLHDLLPQFIASGTSNSSSLFSGFLTTLSAGLVLASSLDSMNIPAAFAPVSGNATTTSPSVQTTVAAPSVTQPTSPHATTPSVRPSPRPTSASTSPSAGVPGTPSGTANGTPGAAPEGNTSPPAEEAPPKEEIPSASSGGSSGGEEVIPQ